MSHDVPALMKLRQSVIPRSQGICFSCLAQNRFLAPASCPKRQCHTPALGLSARPMSSRQREDIADRRFRLGRKGSWLACSLNAAR